VLGGVENYFKDVENGALRIFAHLSGDIGGLHASFQVFLSNFRGYRGSYSPIRILLDPSADSEIGICVNSGTFVDQLFD
jgi:hypothetical protein